MSVLRLRKRLASRVLRCGTKKVWLDPSETHETANAGSHQQIRKLIRDGLIIQKPVTVCSGVRCRKNTLARQKGRHTHTGKRKGTASARIIPCRLLRRYRESKEIARHTCLTARLARSSWLTPRRPADLRPRKPAKGREDWLQAKEEEIAKTLSKEEEEETEKEAPLCRLSKNAKW
uniref:Large ribosomal subunit protein eL19 n=1 Tax=Lynx canadensis TaxID=61383 RepID=A0A667ILS3_LYNCA